MLKDEITNDPLGRGYSTMSDFEVAQSLNAVDRVSQRTSISGSELFGYTDEAEYSALAAGKKQQWLSLCAIDIITKNAIPIIKSIFPSNTTTWSNIIKTETISRAEELGLSKVREGTVARAR